MMQSSVYMLQKMDMLQLHIIVITKCSEEESKSNRNRQYEHKAGGRLLFPIITIQVEQ